MMAVGVVDKLEVVKVQHAEGEGRACRDQRPGKAQHVLAGDESRQRVEYKGDVPTAERLIKVGIFCKLFLGIHN